VAKTKKEAIINTALKLFVENGIDATSVRAIAQGADTAEGNIYRHFESKDELAREIFLTCTNHFRAALQDAVKDLNDPEEQIKTMVRTFFEFSVSKRKEFAYLLVVPHRKEIITDEILKKPLPKDVFEDIITDGINKGLFRPIDPTLAVAWFVGMVQRAFTFMEKGMTSLSHEKVAEQTVEAALRAIKK
jgi:AcrR family transcriptional regulator